MIDKVCTSANSLLSDVFGLLSSRNFATMATWRNDFSSLLAWPQGLNPQPLSMVSFGGECQCS